MKRISKILVMILCLALVLSLFTGCGNDGTYYYMDEGVKNKENWIEIDGDIWTDSLGLTGTAEINGNDVILYVELMGMEFELMTGVKDGNTIVYDLYGVEMIYTK
ncbi:MAG: hypothetical protein R3Y32_05555 [Bacillota bacterium]